MTALDPIVAAQVEHAMVYCPPRRAAVMAIHNGQPMRACGVLVPGNLIVTAAHVIARPRLWRSRTFGHAYREYQLERVRVGTRMIRMAVESADPISDVAVLAVPDLVKFPKWAPALEAYLETVALVSLCSDELSSAVFPVWILSHDRGWVEGQARQGAPGAGYCLIHASQPIAGGTSGSPVVTPEGLLLGVVSTSGGEAGPPGIEVGMARLTETVPAGLLRTMVDPEWKVRAVRAIIKSGQ